MIVISILVYIVALAISYSNKNEINNIIYLRISSIVLIYAGILSVNIFYVQYIEYGIGIYGGLFQITTFSAFSDIFLLFIAGLVLVPRPLNLYLINLNQIKFNIYKFISSPVKDNEKISNIELNKDINIENLNLDERNKINTNSLLNINLIINSLKQTVSVILSYNYSVIALFSVLGSLLLVSSADLLSMYLSIELQSFGVYILATLYRDSILATSAGLKYFLLGGFSSCLILLGAGLVYSFTGLTNLDSIYSLLSVSDNISVYQGLTFGIFLIFIGLLFKIAAAPLHNWSPDVYDDSPTIVTIWLTIMPKIAILFFMAELFIGGISYNMISNINTIGNSENIQELNFYNISIIYDLINSDINIKNMGLITENILKNLLLISSLLSLIIGTVVGLAQIKIKRLLA